jgi:hypothetical protein
MESSADTHSGQSPSLLVDQVSETSVPFSNLVFEFLNSSLTPSPFRLQKSSKALFLPDPLHPKNVILIF